MNILYSDNSIIVCEKPSNIACETKDARETTIIKLLQGDFPNDTFYLVHRLDKVTGGIMVFAKDSQSAASLSQQICNRKMQKKYLAVCEGSLECDKGTLEDLLFFDKTRNKSYAVKKQRNGVKKAKLDYSILAVSKQYSLADITLHTGRTHQIRIQFATRKHPLYGDRKYGSTVSDKSIGLFSYSLQFQHPKTKKIMNFTLLPNVSSGIWAEFKEQINNLSK